jgi:hypothetical protein
MARKHPNKEIRAALDYAEQSGWIVKEGGSQLGVRFIVLTMILNVGAVSFVLLVFGVLLKTPLTMQNRFVE